MSSVEVMNGNCITSLQIVYTSVLYNVFSSVM